MPPKGLDLTGYTIDADPKPDQAVEVLCRDAAGAYTLPFLCHRRDGVWLNAKNGRELEVEALGWRVKRGFKNPS